MFVGDFGYSFEYQLPVADVVGDRLWLTMLVSFVTIIFTWIVAFPIGIYSATHQYSWSDYGLTFLGLLGLATPNFLLALVFLYFANIWFGISIGHLMDPQYFNEPMSWAKFKSILSHLWIPVIIIGIGGTAGMIRRLRANLLDELQKQYVITARAKGLTESQVLYGHIFRNAMLIIIAGFPGAFISSFFAGSLLIETIFSLEGLGLLGFESVMNRDYPVVFATVYIFSLMGLIINLVSDLTYTWVDPRIDFETREV
jgi:peptide/nickel transport system permease protein